MSRKSSFFFTQQPDLQRCTVPSTNVLLFTLQYCNQLVHIFTRFLSYTRMESALWHSRHSIESR